MEKIIRSDLESLRSYEAGKTLSQVQKELGVKKVVKLASNESPYLPFPQAFPALERGLSEINRYPDEGCPLLRERLAIFLEVPPENLIFGHGSNELIRLLVQAVLNPGEEAVAPTPSFALYPRVIKVMGGKIKKIRLKNYRLDLEAMLSATSRKTKIIFVCNPNNPTGTVVYQKEIEEFLEQLPKNILVLFDEAYFEYVDDPQYPNMIDYFRQHCLAGDRGKAIAILRTFSKIYSLAGLRIGYGIAPKELVSVVNKIRDPHNVNTLAQAAALASLDGRDEIERRKHLNKEGKDYLYKEFKRMKLKFVPSQANFVGVDVGRNSRGVFEELLKQGVIVRTGDIFGEGFETFLRVTVGKPEENQRFIEALKEVLRK